MAPTYRYVHPVVAPLDRAAAARAGTRSRNSLKRVFPRDERLHESFADIRPDHCFAAFDGEEVAGVLMIRKDRVDPYEISRARFQRIWGGVSGALRYAAYEAMQSLGDDDSAYVEVFWVDPQRRGHGIGGRLLRMLCEGTDRPVSVLARPLSATLYARCGFEVQTGMRAQILNRLIGNVPMRTPAPPFNWGGDGR